MFSLLRLAPLALRGAKWLIGFAEKRSDAEVRKIELATGLKIADLNAQARNFEAWQKTVQVA